MGNYDEGTGFGADECGCAYTDPNEKAFGDASFAWTKAQVSEANKAWLRGLPRESVSRPTDCESARPRVASPDQRVPVRGQAGRHVCPDRGRRQADLIVAGIPTARMRSRSMASVRQ